VDDVVIEDKLFLVETALLNWLIDCLFFQCIFFFAFKKGMREWFVFPRNNHLATLIDSRNSLILSHSN